MFWVFLHSDNIIPLDIDVMIVIFVSFLIWEVSQHIYLKTEILVSSRIHTEQIFAPSAAHFDPRFTHLQHGNLGIVPTFSPEPTEYFPRW